jgi:hypothetical protein
MGSGVNPESQNLVRMHVVSCHEGTILHESTRLYEPVTLSFTLSDRGPMRGYILTVSLIYQATVR